MKIFYMKTDDFLITNKSRIINPINILNSSRTNIWIQNVDNYGLFIACLLLLLLCVVPRTFISFLSCLDLWCKNRMFFFSFFIKSYTFSLSIPYFILYRLFCVLFCCYIEFHRWTKCFIPQNDTNITINACK